MKLLEEGRPREGVAFCFERQGLPPLRGAALANNSRLHAGIRLRLHECKQSHLKRVSCGFGKVDEAKGLQPALSRPHRKHNLRFFVDRGGAELEDQLDFEFLIQRHLYVHQAAADGKLVQFAPKLALVRKTNQG